MRGERGLGEVREGWGRGGGEVGESWCLCDYTCLILIPRIRLGNLRPNKCKVMSSKKVVE